VHLPPGNWFAPPGLRTHAARFASPESAQNEVIEQENLHRTQCSRSDAALYASEQSSTPQTPPETLAAHVLDARVHALKQNKPDAGFEEVERRLTRLYNNSSAEADEAVVILMSFYLGEHNGEELYENLLSRGPRMIPIIERYLHERPAIAARYPKELQLDRNTTVMYLGESLETLKVQAGARHISKMSVETAPLRQQSDSCKPRLVHRLHINFRDNLIRTGEKYRSNASSQNGHRGGWRHNERGSHPRLGN
jgi:hypothetical protein